MTSPKPPSQQMMWSHQPDDDPVQPTYGIPVGFSPYPIPTGIPAGDAPPPPMAPNAEPAMGVPVGSLPSDEHDGPQMFYGRRGMNLGTEQDHDAALVATCCCGKWGMLGTVLCCPSTAGIAGMCQGCGINLISTAMAYSLFLVLNLYAFHGPRDWPEWAEHYPELRGPRHQPPILLGFVALLMVLSGTLCLLYGARQYAHWRRMTAHVVPGIPVATVDV